MVVRVASPNTIVDPDTVCLKAISALVAHLAMFRPGWLDHFAIGTELGAWQLFK